MIAIAWTVALLSLESPAPAKAEECPSTDDHCSAVSFERRALQTRSAGPRAPNVPEPKWTFLSSDNQGLALVNPPRT